MITIFQFLGLCIPVFFLIFVWGKCIRDCNNGHGNEPADTWVVVLSSISILILGFTLGTIVVSNL